LQRILTEDIVFKRSFYLVRHADDRRLERMNRFAAALSHEIAKEIDRLERFA